MQLDTDLVSGPLTACRASGECLVLYEANRPDGAGSIAVRVGDGGVEVEPLPDTCRASGQPLVLHGDPDGWTLGSREPSGSLLLVHLALDETPRCSRLDMDLGLGRGRVRDAALSDHHLAVIMERDGRSVLAVVDRGGRAAEALVPEAERVVGLYGWPSPARVHAFWMNAERDLFSGWEVCR